MNYWTKKLVDEGVLIRLRSGLYASAYYADLMSQSHEDQIRYLEYIANQLRSPSYVSLEYVLAKSNVIAEAVFEITSVTLKSTRIYKTKLGTFIYRNVKEERYGGYEVIPWRDKQVKIAGAAKALADWRYLNKRADESRINLNGTK